MLGSQWDADTLYDLYYTQGKTLADIGEIYHVTRERVRQVMEKAGLKRISSRSQRHPNPWNTCKSMEEYIGNGSRRKADKNNTLCKFFDKTTCSICGSKRNLHLHHRHYPIREEGDIEILCASCHFIKHRRGITHGERFEIYSKYTSGKTAKNLAEEYNIALVTVHRILQLVRQGAHSFADIKHKKRL